MLPFLLAVQCENDDVVAPIFYAAASPCLQAVGLVGSIDNACPKVCTETNDDNVAACASGANERTATSCGTDTCEALLKDMIVETANIGPNMLTCTGTLMGQFAGMAYQFSSASTNEFQVVSVGSDCGFALNVDEVQASHTFLSGASMVAAPTMLAGLVAISATLLAFST